MSGFDLSKIGAMPSVTPDNPKTGSGTGNTTGNKWAKPGVLTFYKLHSIPNADKSYKITKFNSDLDVESSYFMNYIPSNNGGYYDCQCPASRFDCRHKAIMKTIVENNEVDGDKFFCFETKTFRKMEEIQ